MTQQTLIEGRVDFRSVTAAFLRCPEAAMTVVLTGAAWLAAFGWGARSPWMALVVLGGFGLWFVVEHPIHRFVLHMPPPRAAFLRRMMRRLHYAHHERPTDPALLFLPWWVSLPSLALILGVATLLSDSTRAIWFLAGFCSALTVYEWMHFAVHARYRPDLAPVRRTFDAHMWHHFKHEGYWFGVSNNVVDRVWGTAPPVESVGHSPTVRRLFGDGGEGPATDETNQGDGGPAS